MENDKYLSVTALTKYIKYKFDNDTHLRSVFLKAEVSNFKHHSRGHFYFTLKDNAAQISAIMFNNQSKKVPFKVEDGMTVLVEGYIGVYEASGGYQIYVNEMTQDGIGNLYLAYEQLKKKLASEGLFDQAHKKQLPKFPKTIGVLTSPTGAAVRDIINIVNRRYPLSKIIIYPTLVQGEYAKDSIVEQITNANNDNLVDVIILGRGGGSIEDLWPFNEEIVAYSIYKSKIPIISSVGHETDFTISDFVADLRAPTPSGGAELAVPNQQDLFIGLNNIKSQLTKNINNLLDSLRQKVSRVEQSYIFRDPLVMLEKPTRKLDFLEEKLLLLSPSNLLNQNKEKVNNLINRLESTTQKRITLKNNEFNILINKLELLNPLSIMKKGYSVTKLNNKFITSIKEVKKDEMIDIYVTDGSIKALIKETRKDDL